MSGADLCYLPASDLLKKFQQRELSPVEVLDAQIARAEAVEPRINAFTDRYFDEARAHALASERRYAGGSALPLDGLLLAVKDAQRVAGKRTTHGSLVFADNVDEVSDPMVERLIAAGAIIHARTAASEFCLSAICSTRMWGETRNPFGPDHGPGGSSGGSAAALAAGTTTLATGTDIGGSIRIPASCCGVVGYKPPKGRNPDGTPASMDPYNHCGPLARSVADIALVQNVVSGPHPRDHASLRDRIVVSSQPGSLHGLHIAWSMNLGYVAVSPDVRANTLASLQAFRDLGATVEEVEIPWSDECDRAAIAWYNTMHYGRQVLWHAQKHAELLTDYALAMAEAVRNHDPDDTARSWDVQDEMYQSFGRLMEGYDLFVCPTTSIPALPLDRNRFADALLIEGKLRDPEYGWILTHQFNMLFNCPVMSVPSGKAANGLPTGIQLVGRTFDDATVFRAAAAYEDHVGGWYGDAWRPRL